MQQTFEAVLEHYTFGMNWIVVRVPFDPKEAWPERAGLRVRGTIESAIKAASHPSGERPAHSFRSALFSSSEGYHFLIINQKMQKAARVTAGQRARLTLEPDLEERSTAPTPEFAKILKSDRTLKKWYEQLSTSSRKDIATWLTQPKSAESRQRRAEQLAERMMLTMEAEETLPPILQIAFRAHPQAFAGWQAMTPIQRRTHLFGIFAYQSVEAREKRTAQTIEAALRIARKKQQ